MRRVWWTVHGARRAVYPLGTSRTLLSSVESRGRCVRREMMSEEQTFSKMCPGDSTWFTAEGGDMIPERIPPWPGQEQ